MTNDTLETKSRLVAWQINSLDQIVGAELHSKEFMIGKWYWLLELCKLPEKIQLILKPKDKQSIPIPIASFIVYVFCSKGISIKTTKRETTPPHNPASHHFANSGELSAAATSPFSGRGSSRRRRAVLSLSLSMATAIPCGDDLLAGEENTTTNSDRAPPPQRELKSTCDEFKDFRIPYGKRYSFYTMDMNALPGTTPVTFGVKFLDLKMEDKSAGESYSIWEEDYSEENASNEPICRMLSDSIYTDILINASDGSIAAHRAVLAANSPVFKTMFSGNYIEKETSTVNMDDMSIGACRAMLNFMYGKRESNELRPHNMELILAADKYDIVNFKKACEVSLCEDVCAKNVFEKLICAHRYYLLELKATCLFYLVKMGMIFDLREEYNSFILEADPELLVVVSNACLDAWQAT